jgi:hypothetical protein
MTEDKRGSRSIDRVQVGLRQTVRGVYFERRHADDGCSSLLNRVWPVARDAELRSCDDRSSLV